MILYAVIAFAVAIGLIQLGAQSVWVTILSLVIKVILGLALGAALFFGVPSVWRRFKSTRTKQ